MAKLTRVTDSLITVDQPSAGAVSRLLEDKLTDVLSPKDFGAKADGVTNDTAALAACMAATPEGGSIDLRGGTYLAELIVTKDNIKVSNGTIKAPFDATKGCVVALGRSGVRVSNLTTIVDVANKASYTADNVSGVHFENCSGVSVSHVEAIGSKNNTYGLTGSWGCPIHAYESDNVSISFCTAKDADKEGIMTRMSDDVFINNCVSTNAGYSCIGTSGGDRATISSCRATGSGATAITMNSRVSNVLKCIVDGGGAFAGINIGHDTEAQQYALDASVSNNIIRNCVGNGVSISKGQRVTASNNIVTNVTLDGVHIHSMTGNTANLLSVVVTGNTVVSAGRSGVWCYESDPALNVSYIVSDNQLDLCTLYGIRVNANRDISITGNILRSITDVAILVRAADNSTSGSANNITINGNTVLSCTSSAISSTPARMMSINGNKLYGFNSASSAFANAITVNGSISGVNYTLPNELQINGNIIEGTIGSSTTIINISTDNGSTADRQLQINSNLIRNSGALLTYPTARYLIPQVRGNTKGLDATLVTVSVPASGTLVVTNSNQTAYGVPRITARNIAGLSVYVTSLSDGSITLGNNSASAASVTLEW